MKKLLTSVLAVFIALVVFTAVAPTNAEAVYVHSYYRSNGTYVNSYYRSRANAYTYDNYSYKAPTYSNGYGYNNSYYNSTHSTSSNWYKPSTSDTGYSQGYNSYQYNHYSR